MGGNQSREGLGSSVTKAPVEHLEILTPLYRQRAGQLVGGEEELGILARFALQNEIPHRRQQVLALAGIQADHRRCRRRLRRHDGVGRADVIQYLADGNVIRQCEDSEFDGVIDRCFEAQNLVDVSGVTDVGEALEELGCGSFHPFWRGR